MSRIFGGHGFVSASAIGAIPDGIYCALCSGSVDLRGKVHVASMRAVCGYCIEANGHDSERLASRLSSLDQLVSPTMLDVA